VQDLFLLRQLDGLQGSLFATATMWAIAAAETVFTLPPFLCLLPGPFPSPLQLAAVVGFALLLAAAASVPACLHGCRCCSAQPYSVPDAKRWRCCAPRQAAVSSHAVATRIRSAGQMRSHSVESVRTVENPMAGAARGDGAAALVIGSAADGAATTTARATSEDVLSPEPSACASFFSSAVRCLLHVTVWLAPTLLLLSMRQSVCRSELIQGLSYLQHDTGVQCLSPLHAGGIVMAVLGFALIAALMWAFGLIALLPRLLPRLVGAATRQAQARAQLALEKVGAAGDSLSTAPPPHAIARAMLRTLQKGEAFGAGDAPCTACAACGCQSRRSLSPANPVPAKAVVPAWTSLLAAAGSVGVWHGRLYAPDRSWWPATRLARVVGACVLLVAVDSSALQGVGVLFLYAASLAAVEGLRPHPRTRHQNIELAQQLACTLTALLDIFSLAIRAQGAPPAGAAGDAPGLLPTTAVDSVGLALLAVHGVVLCLTLAYASPFCFRKPTVKRRGSFRDAGDASPLLNATASILRIVSGSLRKGSSKFRLDVGSAAQRTASLEKKSAPAGEARESNASDATDVSSVLAGARGDTPSPVEHEDDWLSSDEDAEGDDDTFAGTQAGQHGSSSGTSARASILQPAARRTLSARGLDQGNSNSHAKSAGAGAGLFVGNPMLGMLASGGGAPGPAHLSMPG
jgi:hypothetical protein